MGYPYDKTYLEQIQESKQECKEIATAFYVLRRKYMREHGKDDIELSLQEQFSLLGEAFDIYSSTVSDITDQYHFMWDVIEALLGKGV